MQNVLTQNTRMPVSQVPGIGKKDLLYLWSTYRLFTGDPAGVNFTVFSVQQTVAGQGFARPLTQRETSLQAQPGQVPLDQRWEAVDLGVEILPGAGGASVTTAQANDLYNKMQLVFNRAQTQAFQLGPISLFPGGSGLSGIGIASATVTAANVEAIGNGFPSIGARRQLRGGRTIMLNPGDTWNMSFVNANADGAAIDLGVNQQEAPNSVDLRVSMWMLRDLGLSG